MKIQPVLQSQSNMQKNTNFKGLTIMPKMSNDLLDLVQNSNNLAKIAEKYDVKASEYITTLFVEKPVQSLALSFSKKVDQFAMKKGFKGFLQKLSKLNPFKKQNVYKMEFFNLPMPENYSGKNWNPPSISDRLKALSVESVEDFIAKKKSRKT